MRQRPRQRNEAAKCPFCRSTIPRPRRRGHAEYSLLPGGKCECGAVYVVDPTSRNGGAALLEVLKDASGLDDTQACGLVRHRDYVDYMENYDTKFHSYIKGMRGYVRGMARIYFVRMKSGGDS